MPETAEIKRTNDTVNLENEPFQFDMPKLQEDYALSLVVQTFNSFEMYRNNNHDRRWNLHDALYTGYLPQKVWANTTVPRSSLSAQIVFDQVESAQPAISQAIFNSGSGWFNIEPAAGLNIAQARNVQKYLENSLELPRDEGGAIPSTAEIELIIKSTLLYGNGVGEVCWDNTSRRPYLVWVDLRDVYFDPKLSTSNVDESRAFIRRRLITVDDLTEYRNVPGFNIPSNEILWSLAKTGPTLTTADNTKTVQENLRGVSYIPEISDRLPSPDSRNIEILAYYTKKKIIWVLNRRVVIYNETNPYGFIPFIMAPAYIMLSRAYAQSIGDVQEGNQRYTEGLLNGRLDELTLMLHPPKVLPRSAMVTPAQQKWHPGGVMYADDPKGVQFYQSPNATGNIYSELNWLEIAAEKRTGINGLGMGVPRPSNANRTKGGMQMQLAGSASRLSSIVSNFENYFLTPALYKMWRMAKTHLNPEEEIFITRNGNTEFFKASELFGRGTIKCLAASRMMTREKISEYVPFMAQYLFSGPLLQQLTKSGMTVDFSEFFKMVQDASGTEGKYSLVRQMTPEEFQASQQPPPELVAQQQAQAQDAQVRLQMGQMKAQTDIQKELIKKSPNQGEMEKIQAELQADREKAEIQKAVEYVKLLFQQQKMQMELAKKKADIDVNIQDSQTKMQLNQQQHVQKLEQMRQMADTERETGLNEHVMGMMQAQDEHNLSMEQQKEAGQMKQRFSTASSGKPQRKIERTKKRAEREGAPKD